MQGVEIETTSGILQRVQSREPKAEGMKGMGGEKNVEKRD